MAQRQLEVQGQPAPYWRQVLQALQRELKPVSPQHCPTAARRVYLELQPFSLPEAHSLAVSGVD
jgi:hypothetical protein